ncbi:hypothetical protein EZS27_000208 [termite gut metagenome]|uniref:Uncharacterized protein n=1 Tax=termite gut metagenome TaxID=433724 RepID=A0A5J4T506_9ZZZZ
MTKNKPHALTFNSYTNSLLNSSFHPVKKRDRFEVVFIKSVYIQFH